MRRVLQVAVSVTAISCAACGAPPAPPPDSASVGDRAALSTPAPPYKAAVDMRTLMNAVIERPANVVWESVGEVHTPAGIERRSPKTDQEWQTIRDAAVTVTEAGNLLMMPGRSRDDEWMQSAAGLIKEGERMIAAIDRKNTQDVFDIGADIYEACVRCHSQYMPGVREMYR